MNKNVISDNFLFPLKHLPPCFSNDNLISYLDFILIDFLGFDNLIKNYYSVDNNLIKEFRGFKDNRYGYKKGTEPIHINISKPNGGNRIISIPNPVALIPLHFYLDKYCTDILLEQEEDSEYFLSSSKFFIEEGKISTNYDYDEEPEKFMELNQREYKNKFINSHKICNGKYFHLAIDISNFYNSIYTHTISWDLKDVKNKCIFENLDILTRTMNFNETKGILIGPYTSSLFSELILSKVDRSVKEQCITNNISYIRYCDDFDLYSDSRDVLENNIKKTLSESLAKYKLDLNMDKMKLEEFPFISLNTVQNKSIFLLLKRIEEKDYENSLEFIEDIINEINNSLRIKYSNCNYLLKKLIVLFKSDTIEEKYLEEDTAEILLDFLINMMFKNNLLSFNTCELINIIFDKIHLNKKVIIEKWIRKRYDRKAHIKEITDIWLLYLILNLNIKSSSIDTYVLSMINEGDIELLLSFEYFYVHNKIKEYKSEIKEKLNKIEEELKYRFGSNWKNAGYYSRYWLLFYTNSIRWKYHQVDGFKNSILKMMYLPYLSKTFEKELKLFQIMYNYDIELVSFKYDDELLL